MKRLLLLSNRLPYTVVKKKNKFELQPSMGGLASGLGSIYKKFDSLWIGWPGISSERLTLRDRNEIRRMLAEKKCHPVFLSRREMEQYYNGFCNRTLWPLFHYFNQFTVYSDKLYKSYQHVNKVFCDAVHRVSCPDDIIWVHDYHLMLLPRMLRETMASSTIGFFLHIPFPSFEVFRLLPWRKQILAGLLGSDLVGFHTYDYVIHFLDSVHRLKGYEHSVGRFNAGDRMIQADVFPMGIDYDRFNRAPSIPEVKREISKIRKKVGDRKVILSIDRLDYSKGIQERLAAFDLFLDNHPEYREKVILILVAVPSRTRIEHYTQLKKEVEELIGKINGKHGTMGFVPVWYLYRSLPFPGLTALYEAADVALVTPMRDGMNLIAKEYLATKTDGSGVLILSEMTGASHELVESLIINPNNKVAIAEAIHKALSIPLERQIEKNRSMRERLRRYDVQNWSNDFITRLEITKNIQRKLSSKQLVPPAWMTMKERYVSAGSRLLLLDYDGTLVPFAAKPDQVPPPEELQLLLASLTCDERNDLVIVSGRDRKTLDRWFGDMNVSLIAEHGLLYKDSGGAWKASETVRTDWKDNIRPILQLYSDRTPGSFVEEKEYSLVWHYRKTSTELAAAVSNELIDILKQLTSKLNLDIQEGNKVIEVKNIGINKGRTALRWIRKTGWDFILAVGDDVTDEDVFAVLPDNAFSIKVGMGASRARYQLESPLEVKALLNDLAGARPPTPLYPVAGEKRLPQTLRPPGATVDSHLGTGNDNAPPTLKPKPRG
jgi:trehalose 6-phosphate synthase/phosphatase